MSSKNINNIFNIFTFCYLKNFSLEKSIINNGNQPV